MIGRRRGILVAVTIVTLVVASGAAVLLAWSTWLPDPRSADRQGVLRWLVLRDLSQEPLDVQQQLVHRVEELFGDGVHLDGAAQLSDDQLGRVRANADLLKEVWFHEKVDGFCHCAAADRPAYLDRQITTIQRWAEIDKALADARSTGSVHPSQPSADLGAQLAAFFDTLDQWTLRAVPARRLLIRQTVKAGLVRWLATTDLRTESPPARQKLVRGLEQQLGGELDLIDPTTGYTPHEKAAFWSNVEVLSEAWFIDKAKAYVRLPKAQRDAFVERQLGMVEQLMTQDAAASAASTSAAIAHGTAATGSTAPAAANSAAAGRGVMAKIDDWIRHASPDDSIRRQLRQFADHLRSSLFARRVKAALEGFFGTPN